MTEPDYLKVEDFFRDASTTNIFEDVREQTRRENDRPITTSEAYSAAGIDGEAWSELGSQVVGAEHGKR